MKKKLSKTPQKPVHRSPELQLAFPLEFSANITRILSIVLGSIAIAITLFYVLPMKEMVGARSFPLDDPWIHLTFARNIAEYGSYSYFQDSMVTSGSTSPLYTLLLSILWHVSQDEFLISFILGIGFFAFSAIFLYRLALHFFEKEHWLALGAVAAFLFVGKMHLASVSGMETTFFVFFLLATAFYYVKGKQILFAIFAGLLLWSRPDGLILLLAIAMQFLYQAFVVKKKRSNAASLNSFRWKTLFTPGILGFILVGLYFMLNLSLSGSFFPNTVVAKAKYYGGGSPPEYFLEVWKFYSSPVLNVFVGFFFVALIDFIMRIVRRENISLLFPAFFVLGMILTYWIELPFLYQDGRYIIPTIPFFLIVSVYGMRRLFQWLIQILGSPMMIRFGNVMTLTLFLLAILIGVFKIGQKRREYFETCRYIYDRQVAAANWIAKNTPENSVVATHDIGAIAFYGKRRIVDMVGLVSPEMIPNIGDLGKLESYIRAQKTTHVATLRNWFELVNQNPIFHTDEQQPEIMEIVEYRPNVTHIVPQVVTSLNMTAAQYLQKGDIQTGMRYLSESYKIDAKSVRTISLIGLGWAAAGDTARAIKILSDALTIQPDYVPAIVPLAKLKTHRKEYNEAFGMLQFASQIDPTYPPTHEAIQFAMRQKKEDSLKALGYTRRTITIPIE